MNYEINIYSPKELDLFQKELEIFEKSFDYPLGEDSFRIDHGRSYSSFFTLMGKPFFVVARCKKEIVGLITVVEKEISFSGKKRKSLYFCDLKIKKGHRENRLSYKIYRKLFFYFLYRGYFLKNPFAYFIAMQKEGLDLMRSKGSFSWLSFFSPFAKFKIYFLSIKELERLESIEVNEKTYSKTLDLSFSRVKKKRELIDLKSVKDLILKSTQSPLNFLHLRSFQKRGHDFINYLSQARRDLSKEEKLCFALDSKRESLIKQLSELDIHSSGEAKAYCCRWQKKRFSKL